MFTVTFHLNLHIECIKYSIGNTSVITSQLKKKNIGNSLESLCATSCFLSLPLVIYPTTTILIAVFVFRLLYFIVYYRYIPHFPCFWILLKWNGASLVAELVKNLPAMQETWVWTLPGESPWTEVPGGLQFVELQRLRHDRVTKGAHAHTRTYPSTYQHTHTHTHLSTYQYTYTHTSLPVSTHTHTHLCLSVHTHTHTSLPIGTHTHTSLPVSTHTYTSAYQYTHTHLPISTHTHTHTHTPLPINNPKKDFVIQFRSQITFACISLNVPEHGSI